MKGSGDLSLAGGNPVIFTEGADANSEFKWTGVSGHKGFLRFSSSNGAYNEYYAYPPSSPFSILVYPTTPGFYMFEIRASVVSDDPDVFNIYWTNGNTNGYIGRNGNTIGIVAEPMKLYIEKWVDGAYRRIESNVPFK